MLTVIAQTSFVGQRVLVRLMNGNRIAGRVVRVEGALVHGDVHPGVDALVLLSENGRTITLYGDEIERLLMREQESLEDWLWERLP